MDELQKVELVREKADVSYEDAKEALDASDGNVLDAIIWLEHRGKAKETTASYSTQAHGGGGSVSPEMAKAQQEYQDSTRQSEFWEGAKRLLRKSIDYKFVASRHGEFVVRVPVLVPVLGLFLWGATLWLLIIGLFFGLRYRIDGRTTSVTTGINDAMDSAANAADTIRHDVRDKM